MGFKLSYVYCQIFFIYMISFVVSNTNDLGKIIENTESYLKIQASLIYNLTNNKCDFISGGKCTNEKPKSIRFLENSATNSTQPCESTSCRSEIVEDVNLKCFNNPKLILNESSNPNVQNILRDTNSTCNNQKLYTDKSLVQLSNAYFPMVDKDSIETQETICLTKKLDQNFINEYQNNPLLVWQAYGSNNGVFRRFPGGLFCGNYDHRRTNWYKAAVRRPLNVLFALDFSGGMNSSGKKQLLVRSITNFLESLESHSWFGILPLSTQIEADLFDGNLIKATSQNVQKVLNIIKEITFKGEFDLDLTKIDEFLSKSKKMGVGVSCSEAKKDEIKNTLVVYMVGQKLENFKRSNSTTEVASYNSFFLEFNGNLPVNDFLKQEQCKDKNMYFQVNNPTNLESATLVYLEYLTLGNKRDSPVWNYYDDTFHTGQVLTGSIPVYKDHELLGVYAVDLSMDKIKKLNKDWEFMLDFYTNKADECDEKMVISECKLEEMRQIKCRDDSISFSNKCKEEKNKSPFAICQNSGLEKSSIYCESTSDFQKLLAISNMNSVSCCYSDLEKFNNFYLNKENFNKNDMLYDLSSSTNNNTTNSNSNSENNSDNENKSSESETKNITELITPNNLTNSTSTENGKNETTNQTTKNQDDQKQNKSLLILIFVVAVIAGVYWYINKNQPKSFNNEASNREDRELREKMMESTKTSRYN